MPLFTSRRQEKKAKVTFSNGLLFVEKEEGSKPQVFPLEFFPKLMEATDEERADWTQTEHGIHWNKLDLDVDL
jgi:hypothetical protein